MRRTTRATAFAIALVTLTCALPAFSPVAWAVDTVTSKDAPDLGTARQKIKAGDWTGAIADLNSKIDAGIQHADLYNLLGYSLRKGGDLKAAYTFYRKALEFDPDHKGALEYLGELHVETGDVAKAREQLAHLKKLCPQGCEELADLEKAIATAPVNPQAADKR